MKEEIYASKQAGQWEEITAYWVSYDAVISVLLQIIKALEVVKACGIDGNWSKCIAWAKTRLDEVWKERGAFPGLGAMLVAAGFMRGELIAKENKKIRPQKADFVTEFYEIIKCTRKYLPDELTGTIGATELNTLLSLDRERKKVFWLLSRISLSPEYAATLFFPENRECYGVHVTDAEIIENPLRFSPIQRNVLPACLTLPTLLPARECYYEQSLIHTTLKGELVRSKAKVIIANMLYDNNI